MGKAKYLSQVEFIEETSRAVDILSAGDVSADFVLGMERAST
jgi:hypothetical protein